MRCARQWRRSRGSQQRKSTPTRSSSRRKAACSASCRYTYGSTPLPEKLWAAYGHHFASVPPREKEVAKYIEACKAEATVRVADTRGTVAPDTDNNASVGISAVQMATHAATNKRKDESGASEASPRRRQRR